MPLSGTERGRAQLTIGAGGDRTMELDRAAEADVFAELEALASRGEKFAVLSEEAGLRRYGADFPRVLVDPVDGSLNAKQGALRKGEKLEVIRRSDGPRLELVAFESLPKALTAARGLVQRAGKIRILGSMALAIAHTAAGSFDAFCAPIPVRVFDMAASLLIVSEAGGVATDVNGSGLEPLPCTLEARTTLLCAPNPELHSIAMRAFGER